MSNGENGSFQLAELSPFPRINVTTDGGESELQEIIINGHTALLTVDGSVPFAGFQRYMQVFTDAIEKDIPICCYVGGYFPGTEHFTMLSDLVASAQTAYPPQKLVSINAKLPVLKKRVYAEAYRRANDYFQSEFYNNFWWVSAEHSIQVLTDFEKTLREAKAVGIKVSVTEAELLKYHAQIQQKQTRQAMETLHDWLNPPPSKLPEFGRAVPPPPPFSR